MIKILLITIVIASIVIIAFHIKQFIQIPKESELELQQIENYNHLDAESIIHKKNLLIIRKYKELNKLININSLLKFNKKIKFIDYPDISMQKVILNKLNSFLFYKINFNDNKLPIIKQFGSDLSFQNNIFVSYGKSNSTTSIISLNYNRNFFHVVKGSIRICLFSPNYRKQLYLTKSKQNPSILSSSINLEKPEYLLYPEFKNIQNEYIEIVLRKGNLFFIPNKWSFYIKYLEDTTLLHYTFDTLISKVFSFIPF